MDPLGFLNNAIRRVVGPAGDVLNVLSYTQERPKAGLAEAGAYGLSTIGASRALQPKRGVGPDVAVGLARAALSIGGGEVGRGMSDAIAPYDLDEYLRALVGLGFRKKIDPATLEQIRRTQEVHKPLPGYVQKQGLGPMF